MAFIEVKNITKNYQIFKRENGFKNSVKSLFYREYELKEAVKNVNFEIEKGETVGYIGMNGAGKSTTLKMLAGILTPTGGTIHVGGIVPYERRKENAMQMGAVFGQRSRLNWDLPMTDTFELYRRMYNIDSVHYTRNVLYYTQLLEMGEFQNRPVRQLSLGEKMRANLALAFLHNPKVVYLDEPTIGLDVVAKARIREFIREINEGEKTTVILTTHDMADIEKICDRLIFLYNGEVFYDGRLTEFKEAYGYVYKISVVCTQDLEARQGLSLISSEHNKYVFEGDKRSLGIEQALASVMGQGKMIASLQVEEASIEKIVMNIAEDAKQKSNH
ncbi:MAG: ATP-binding cassette domain-containing protein [Clostridium sp.]|jgi:ABC-2 type transport system ATP-binding protein|nr:ATP-binding cassette domain-containing protein [Clostridium sp.]